MPKSGQAPQFYVGQMKEVVMDNILQYIFLEILGNLFFQIGRVILRVVTFGSVRLKNPTRFKTFVVALFGFIVGIPALLLFLSLVLGWVAN